MSTDFDAIVIGAGPGGEAAASRLLAGGLRVALIERELIGGECAYWACIPSKTLLRPVEARAEASNVAGLSTPDLDWAGLRDYRDWMIRHLDDTAQDGDHTLVELDDGTAVRTDVIVLGTGRRPRTAGLGLPELGIPLSPQGALEVDEHCRVVDGLWALGDVTGIALFTHVAKYQARVVADAILGRPRRADYTAVPRVVSAQPEIAAVGLTTAGARD